MRLHRHVQCITPVLFVSLALSCFAETYQVMESSQTRKLKVVRRYEIAVEQGKSAVAAVPALMSFWGETNWQLVKSSRFSYSEEPDATEVIADNLGMPRRSYKLTWSAPKAAKITVEQTLDLELTCFNTLHTAAKLPYAEEVRTRLADSLGPDEKEGINPDNPQLEPICSTIVKRSRTAEEVVQEVCNWINENITFVKGKKTSDEALAQRQGSCTPMSRLACAMLRQIGIPAEMVDAKFIGSESGHSFIEVYFPDAGWVFYDLSNWNRGFKSLDCLVTVGWSCRSGTPERQEWHDGYYCVETDIRPYKEFSRQSSRVLSREPKNKVVAGVKVLSSKAPQKVRQRHQPIRQLILDLQTPPGVREYAADKIEQPPAGLGGGTTATNEAPPLRELRRWTSAKGSSVDARLISVSPTQAVLEKSDGKKVTVALSALSKTDLDYIQSSKK